MGQKLPGNFAASCRSGGPRNSQKVTHCRCKYLKWPSPEAHMAALVLYMNHIFCSSCFDYPAISHLHYWCSLLNNNQHHSTVEVFTTRTVAH